MSTMTVAGDERWTTATYCIDECALIKGLRGDTTYRFRVSAINQFGQSPYSWASIEIRTKKKGTVSFSRRFNCRVFFRFPGLCQSSLQVAV